MDISKKLREAADLIQSAIGDQPVYSITVDDFLSSSRFANDGTADATGRNLAEALRRKADDAENLTRPFTAGEIARAAAVTA